MNKVKIYIYNGFNDGAHSFYVKLNETTAPHDTFESQYLPSGPFVSGDFMLFLTAPPAQENRPDSRFPQQKELQSED